MSIRFACGAECSINVAGLAVGGGVSHWSVVGGSPALETTIFRSGLRSYRFPAGGAYLAHTLSAGQAVSYVRMYFRVSNATPSSEAILMDCDVPGANMGLRLTTGGVLRLTDATNTQNYSGSMVANEWYGFELQRDGTADPTRYDWRIWRASTGWVSQTQVTVTATSTQSGFEFGMIAGPASGTTVYLDDIVIGSSTTADQDWSDTVPHGGQVDILRPTADLTHSFSTSGNFRYQNSVNFAQSATDVYTYLNSTDMTQSVDFISQNTSSSGLTKYCYIDFGPTESTLTSVHAVMPVWVVRAAGTSACEMNIRASDNGTNWTNLIGNWGATGQDVSETSNLYRVPAATFAPPSGGSWNQTKVNGLRMQFGMSDDISPVPYVVNLAFEVAWLVEPSPTGSFTADAVIKKTISGSFTANAVITDAYDDLIRGESGVIAYLPMHETSGSSLTDLVGTHDGTPGVVGSGSYTLGQTGIPGGGKSVRLTASASQQGAQIALAGTFSLGDGPLSYEIWVKNASLPTWWVGLFNQNAANTAGCGIDFSDTGSGVQYSVEWFNRSGADAVHSGSSLLNETTTWHHLVFTKDTGLNWKLWFDGADVTTGTQPSGTVVSSGVALYIGSWPDGNCYNGWVTPAAIYNVVLNSTQVADHYAAGLGGVTGSFTADSVIKKTISGSTTLNAIVTDAYDDLIRNTSGVVSYLPMHETSGATVMDLKSAHQGTASGGYTRGETGTLNGKSIRLANASDGLITLANAFTLGDGPFTYEIWLKRATVTTAHWNALFGQNFNGTPFLAINEAGGGGDGHQDTLTSGATGVQEGAQSRTTITDTTTFHHVVLTKSNTDVWKLYLDGTNVTASDGAASTVSNAAALVIGAWPPDAATTCFDGWLTRAAVYNVVLTPTQVMSHFEAGGGVFRPTMDFVCGFECANVATGYEGAPWEVSHWSWDTGTSSLETGIVRTGSRAVRFTTPTSADSCQLEHDPLFGTRRVYARLYFYFVSDPNTATQDHYLVISGDDSTNLDLGIMYHAASDTIRARANGTDSSTNNFTPAQNTWYGVEYWSDGETIDVKWRWWSEGSGWSAPETVNGGGTAMTTFQYWAIGVGIGASGTGVSGFAAIFDDIAVAYDDSADAFWDAGPTDGYVLTYYPTSDGTHGFSTTGDFTKTGANAAAADTNLYTYLDSTDMRNSTEYIASATATNGEYVQVAFGDESGSYDDPRGVSITGRLSSGSQFDIAWDVSTDGSTWDRVLDLQFLPISTVHMLQAPVVSDGFTKADVNAMQARLVDRGAGWSQYGLAMEVEWTSAAAPPVTGSFTTNAIILRAQTGSFTANAVVKKTISGTFAANAVLKGTQIGSFTANAVIKRTQTGSFTADAVIKKTISGSFTASAVIKREQTGTTTLNAVSKKTMASSTTANAIVKATLAAGATANAVIKRNQTGSTTANAVIKAARTGSFTANAVVKATLASSFTTNAIVKKTLAASSTANAVIKRTQASSFTANAVVVRNQLGSFTAAATIKKTQSGSYVLDAVRLGTVTSGFTASAVLVAPRTGSTTASAIILATLSSSRTADAIVYRTISSSFAAEAWVIVVRTDDFTLDAVRLHPGDWSETYGNSVSSTGTGSFTADATILRTQAATFALDAAVTKLQTGSLTASAVLLKTTAGSFTAAAVIRSTLTGSTTANAVILRAGTATFAADAIVKATRSASFVASAVIKAARAGSFDLSASVLRQQTGVLALDAVAKRTQVGAFTLDAVRRALGTGSFDLQATVLRQVADDYTVAAVIRKVNADDYTLDAVVRKVWTEDLTLDAVLRKQATDAFSVDAVTLATPTGQFALEATKALQVYDDFTVEAVLERTTEQSFGLFAVLQLHAEAGVTADAVVLRTQTGSTTARAWLSGTFRLDAVVLRTQVGSFSANAVIMPVFRLDAVVKKTIASASTIDAFIGGVGVAAFSADAVLLRTSSQSFQAEAALKVTQLGVYTVDADLQATQVGQWVLEASKRAVIESSIDVDAVLRRAHLDDLTADATIRAVELGSFGVDACLSKTQAGDDSLDAIVLAHQSSSYLSDAIVRAQRTGSFTLDASIPGAGVGSFAVDAVITRTASATIAANAVLRKTFTSTFTADALLKRATQAAFTANSVVKATRTGGTATNAVLLSPRISGFTADATIVIGAGSGSILLDAVVRGSLTGDFSASALLLRSFTGSLSADAILERTAVGSATLDASISSVGALSFTLDANIFSQTAGTFTIDASISRHIALEIAATFSAATIAAVNTAEMLDATYSAGTIAGSMSADTLGFTWYDTRRTTFSLDAEVT